MNIIEMAKKAGMDLSMGVAWADGESLASFAALVRAEREWVDLTDDEIDSVLRSYTKTDRYKDDLRSYRAVIAALKEKNK